MPEVKRKRLKLELASDKYYVRGAHKSDDSTVGTFDVPYYELPESEVEIAEYRLKGLCPYCEQPLDNHEIFCPESITLKKLLELDDRDGPD